MVKLLSKLLLCFVFVMTNSTFAMARSIRGHGAKAKLKDSFVIIDNIDRSFFINLRASLAIPEQRAIFESYFENNDYGQDISFQEITQALNRISFSQEIIDSEASFFLNGTPLARTYGLYSTRFDKSNFSIKLCLDGVTSPNTNVCDSLGVIEERNLKKAISLLGLLKDSKLISKGLKSLAQDKYNDRLHNFRTEIGPIMGFMGVVIGIALTVLLPITVPIIAIAIIIGGGVLGMIAGFSLADLMSYSRFEAMDRKIQHFENDLDQKIDQTIIRLDSEAFEYEDTEEVAPLP